MVTVTVRIARPSFATSAYHVPHELPGELAHAPGHRGFDNSQGEATIRAEPTARNSNLSPERALVKSSCIPQTCHRCRTRHCKFDRRQANPTIARVHKCFKNAPQDSGPEKLRRWLEAHPSSRACQYPFCLVLVRRVSTMSRVGVHMNCCQNLLLDIQTSRHHTPRHHPILGHASASSVLSTAKETATLWTKPTAQNSNLFRQKGTGAVCLRSSSRALAHPHPPSSPCDYESKPQQL